MITPLTYVNYLGGTPHPERHKAKPKIAKEAVAYHKGWRVLGYSPVHIESARQANEKLRAEAKKLGQEPPPIFTVESFMSTVKPKAVRSKPYELHSSALDCLKLAEKAGWIGLIVREISKVAA